MILYFTFLLWFYDYFTEIPIPAIEKIGVKKYLNAKQISKDEWQNVLTDEEFNITRNSGTELKFTGQFDKNFAPGKYNCLCCGASLFV